MKKKVLFILLSIGMLFMLSGCFSNKEKSYKDLLDLYIEAYSEPSIEKTAQVFPPFYMDFSKEFMTQEYLEKALEEEKKTYGDDLKLSYELTNKEGTKLSDEELGKLNETMARTYKSTVNASECYKYEGKMYMKGSLSENNFSLSIFKYCKYDKDWYLVNY